MTIPARARTLALLALAASLSVAASAQPAPRERVACMPAQAVVPPFNNSAEAMDQSRVAATILTEERTRGGDRPIRVCRTSAVAPQMADLDDVEEVPVDPDYRAPE